MSGCEIFIEYNDGTASLSKTLPSAQYPDMWYDAQTGVGYIDDNGFLVMTPWHRIKLFGYKVTP